MSVATGTLEGAALRTKVEVGFNKGPLDDPTGTTWTDVSADVLSVEVRRGRPSENQSTPPGSATVVLRDTGGKYDPTLNGLGGPNSPNVIPGRRIRVRTSDVGAVIEALRPDFYFPVSLDAAVSTTGPLVGTLEAGPAAFQRIKPSGTTDLPKRYAGQWYVGNGVNPSVLAFKPHVLESRHGSRLERGGYIRTDCTKQFGTLSGVAWINTQSTEASYFCGQSQSFRVGIDTDGKATVDVWLDGAWSGIKSTSTVRDALSWHMIAWTIEWDSLTSTVQVRLYVDGTFEAGGEGTGTVSTSTTARIVVGHMEDNASIVNTNRWDGELCDVAYWSGYTLTPVQIERLATMSDAGTALFTGYVSSWDSQPQDVNVGYGICTVDCVDVGAILAQRDISLDARESLLALNPDVLFTFDTEDFVDVKGGKSARVIEGGAWTEDYSQWSTVGPRIQSGVSSGALQMPAASQPKSLVGWDAPAGATQTKAVAFWFRAASPDVDPSGSSSTITLLRGTDSTYQWELRLLASGVLEVARKNLSTLVTTTTTGTTYVTNNRWRFIVIGTELTIDMVSEFAITDLIQPITRIVGGAYVTWEIDELALWYSTDLDQTADYNLWRVYESGGNKYAGHTSGERVQVLAELVGWNGSFDISDHADMYMGQMGNGDVWSLMQAAAQAEGGTLDVAGDGTIRLRVRHDRRRMGALTRSPAQLGGATIGMTTDDRYLYTAAKVDDAFYQDETAVAKYGIRQLSLSPRMPNTAEAQARAKGLVEQYKDYKPRSDRLRWDLPSMFGGAGLLVDVNDLVTIGNKRYPAVQTDEFVQDCHVESVRWQIDGMSKRATVEAQVSPADSRQNTYWEIGTSTFGGSDVLGW